MKKSVFPVTITVFTLFILFSCTKPSEVIVGGWEGYGEISIGRGKEIQNTNFDISFFKDGSYLIIPTKNEEGEFPSRAVFIFVGMGTYEINNKCEITGEATGGGVIDSIVGSLDMETEEIKLTVTSKITEKAYKENKKDFEDFKAYVKLLGYDENTKALADFHHYDITKEFPPIEDFTVTAYMTFTRATEGEEETEE